MIFVISGLFLLLFSVESWYMIFIVIVVIMVGFVLSTFLSKQGIQQITSISIMCRIRASLNNAHIIMAFERDCLPSADGS